AEVTKNLPTEAADDYRTHTITSPAASSELPLAGGSERPVGHVIRSTARSLFVGQGAAKILPDPLTTPTETHHVHPALGDAAARPRADPRQASRAAAHPQPQRHAPHGR